MREALPDSASVCAVVLAGGRATRMGGLDKGLQRFHGRTLTEIAVERLRQQSVGAPDRIGISANRNFELYAALGLPVWSDTTPDFAGPLAGFQAALQQCESTHEFLLTVPCDSPRFPLDLLERLRRSFTDSKVEIAMATAPDAQSGDVQAIYPQPVFCLLRTGLADSLQAFLDQGGRKIGAWAASHRLVRVAFNHTGDDPRAFANANTLDDLQDLEHS